ncbi:Plasmodium exported protein, unknown function [Plasmodium gonderi]|uniref:Plasmodium RESA N-terminal domain-containing protein n=1 Tax=Plasmodium gonderi TaxID=77519 RepID=A0A1Y1JLV5_PLAGO|nr:Plasmodium exported protein, unknown function [Plasmodium gonderi]GAW83200.1 Plasmodium exported protein, unknown function [Plasmodium gonderi]
MVFFLWNIFPLILALGKFHYSYEWNNNLNCTTNKFFRSYPITYTPGKKYINGNRIGRQYKRILKSGNSNIFQANEESFHQGNGGVDNLTNFAHLQMNSGPLETEEAQYANQLCELNRRITLKWIETYVSMLKKYINFLVENNMNVEWSREMWFERWHTYLRTILVKIKRILVDGVYNMDMKEYYSYLHLHQSKNDFRVFLEIVKSEWKRIAAPQ